MTTELPLQWAAWLADETAKPYWAELQAFLAAEAAAGKTIYPPAELRYAALEAVAPSEVKVVILGQDPYHGPGQAHGFSFSVPRGVRPPPSLLNIFKEIARDLGHTPPGHGNLVDWAGQGVLLLNSVLTVEAGQAGSHRKRGWERFTDALVAKLAREREHLVFMLWGGYAEAKQSLIDPARHCVLLSPHPSPLSAHRGFIGNGHFSAANRYLAEHGIAPIDWALR
ncbi:uracil-DNA glycosylase [Chitinimonas koreensis]|uniref:uracil-DNA glycosylase n=1 Tax=Chitinimonas koreensis TaxID=356302 RepID=UPI000417829D|nr:uracil-DNA glycosylase [Chitinimonas koreensis]QNM98275.1 uracil-DNA glycosylase [Chitinimonas koreensis]